LTTLKIALFAPMPMARIMMTVAVKPGRFRQLRMA
jgi:hypothetical protein